MSELNRPIGDEVLSAYLDHELSSDERARVDRWLEEHEEARRQLQELTQLRDRLRALPRLPVDQDFTARVLARIALEQPSVQRAAPRRDGWRRGLIWAGLIVATSIALLLFQPPTAEQSRELADAPAARTDLERTEGSRAADPTGANQRAASEPAASEPAAREREILDQMSRGGAGRAVTASPAGAGQSAELGAAGDLSRQADQRSRQEEHVEQAAPPADGVADAAAGVQPVPARPETRSIAPPAPSEGRGRGVREQAVPLVVQESVADAPAAPANVDGTRDNDGADADRAADGLAELQQGEALDVDARIPQLGGLILVTGSAPQLDQVVAQFRGGELPVQLAQRRTADADSFDLYFSFAKPAAPFGTTEDEAVPRFKASEAEQLPALQGPGISSLLVAGTSEQVLSTLTKARGVSYQLISDPQQWLATQATTDRGNASSARAAGSALAQDRVATDNTMLLTQALTHWRHRLFAVPTPGEPPAAQAVDEATLNEQPSQQPPAVGNEPSDGAGSPVDLSHRVLVILQEVVPAEP